MYGTWAAEDDPGNYSIEATDGPDAGITVRTPEGEEHYDADQCLQYGTLALVFPREDPEWTLVLNKDCVLNEDGSGIEDGGTLTLCRVGMDKTALLTLDKAGRMRRTD